MANDKEFQLGVPETVDEGEGHWVITRERLQALADLNRTVVLAMAGERRHDTHLLYRLGLVLTPASNRHVSRHSAVDSSLEELVPNLDAEPLEIVVQPELIEALGLPEST